LRRNKITSRIALGAFLVLAALLALRFDLVSQLFPERAATATIQRTSVPKRAIAADAAAPLVRQPADDSAAKTSSSTFDVVRIDPEGASVFAGRAPANASVTVLANEKPVATAKANENGEWATVIERQFAAGDYKLSLMAKPGGPGPDLSGQSVNITIASNAPPAPAQAKVGVAPPEPAPIMFPYKEADLATVGSKQAAALSAFLRQRHPEAVTLSGHADSRGSDEYNMQLSQQRLESVARYLRASGYAGKLVLVPKGKREPFVRADRDKLSPEDAFQLDRRVELLDTAR
jgi:outer membrane protein OmpA-like peptidoglycan-associated protein